MRATGPLVKQTRLNGAYAFKLCLPWTLSGRVLLWYDICQPMMPKLLKLFIIYLIPNPTIILGLYSGIFAIYLVHHGSRQSTDKGKNIIFYALCVLYALTAATIMVDVLIFFWRGPVSMDDHGCLILFWLVVQTLGIAYHLAIIEVTLFACCDFIAQSILVRTTGNAYHLLYSSNSSKDISLLDYVGLQHSCCDRSFIPSTRILRFINLSSFTKWF